MKRAEIKRKAQPAKPRAPMRKQKPSGAAAQCLQRKALSARSGGRCEMERPNLISGGWVRCGLRADDPAHVYTRPKCGAARDLLDAVIHACRPCHVRSEGRLATPMTPSTAKIRRARLGGDSRAFSARYRRRGPPAHPY